MKSFCFFLLILLINNLSEATSHGRKLHSAVVSGSVYCHVCSQQDFSKPHHFISGASVAVECKDENSRPSFRQEAKTDEHGEFRVHLPFSVTKRVRKINRCSVKVIKSSEPRCAVASSVTSSTLHLKSRKQVASSVTSSTLHLKSRKQGTDVFSAGFLSFEPSEQPNLCNKTPSDAGPKGSNIKHTMEFGQPNYPTFPPPLQDPSTPEPSPLLPILPPLPRLPQLPPLPPLPLLPLPPIPGRK